MSRAGRVLFGEEGRNDSLEWVSYVPTAVEYCPDCGVRRSQPHEPGCHLEQCPICREPLVQCGHQSRVLG